MRAARDLESILRYVFLPAQNQGESKQKSLLSVVFFCLWAITASKRKKGEKKRRARERKARAQIFCVSQKISEWPSLGNFDLIGVGVDMERGREVT